MRRGGCWWMPNKPQVALSSGEMKFTVTNLHRFLDWILYTQGGVLAPDGKCKPLDAAADG